MASSSSPWKSLRPNQFRLLTVTPDVHDKGGYTFSLDNYVLDSPSVPNYSVLSYTWSEPLPKYESTHYKHRQVSLQCGSGHWPFKKTTTIELPLVLAIALDHLLAYFEKQWHDIGPEYKNFKRHVRIWVDYICIQPSNPEDKAQQVANLPRIVAGATGILAWVGLPDDDAEAEAALEFAEYVLEQNDDPAQNEETNIGLRSVAQVFREGYQMDANKQDLFRKAWRGIESLLNKAYWSRSWILQEASAPCGTTFLWGSYTLSFRAIVSMGISAMELQSQHRISMDYSINIDQLIDLSILTTARQKPWDPRYKDQSTLKSLLRALRRTDCSDKRDKVYAISGLASDIRIKPSYGKKSVQDLYHEVATLLVQHYDLETLLAFAAHPHLPDDIETIEPLESLWIPNWSYRRVPHPVVFDEAIAGHDMRVTATGKPSICEGTLSVRGFHLDKLSSLSDIHEEATPMPQVLQQWRSLLPICDYERTQESMELAFRRTLVGSGDYGQEWLAAMPSVDLFQRPNNELDPDLLYRRTQLSLAIETRCWKRRFGITTSGLIGLFPAVAQVGDDVCVFQDCRPCYVLRCNADHVTYNFVGECYVHGITHKEAFADIYLQHMIPVWFNIV